MPSAPCAGARPAVPSLPSASSPRHRMHTHTRTNTCACTQCLWCAHTHGYAHAHICLWVHTVTDDTHAHACGCACIDLHTHGRAHAHTCGCAHTGTHTGLLETLGGWALGPRRPPGPRRARLHVAGVGAEAFAQLAVSVPPWCRPRRRATAEDVVSGGGPLPAPTQCLVGQPDCREPSRLPAVKAAVVGVLARPRLVKASRPRRPPGAPREDRLSPRGRQTPSPRLSATMPPILYTLINFCLTDLLEKKKR